jgi:hypothetical protein
LIASLNPPIRPPGSNPDRKENEPPRDRPPPRTIPSRQVLCFCISVFATAHLEVVGPAGGQRLAIRLEDLEIVDIKPDELESNIECFLSTTLRVGILPRLRIALDTMTFELGKFAHLSLSLTPVSASLPNNPAIEDDQLKVFVNVGVSP